MALAGFLIVDKPSGRTSFSVVSLVRRLTGVRRVGHVGTLDPLATGVLPVAIGSATRLIEYMDDDAKTYVATVRFGATTDTYDAEGDVVARADASGLTARAVESALSSFVGEIEQAPPAFSAIKVAGKPLYRYAREGAGVAIEVRRVRIDAARLCSFDAAAEQATIEVECGRGTYIRSLAHDLGKALGCGAHLAALRRTRSGGFGIADAWNVAAIESAAREGVLDELLLACDRPVERQPAAMLAGTRQADVARGRTLVLGGPAGAELCRAYSAEGSFLGMLRHLGEGRWHPEKVFGTA